MAALELLVYLELVLFHEALNLRFSVYKMLTPNESGVWGLPGKNKLQSIPPKETPGTEGGGGASEVEEEKGFPEGRMRLGKARQGPGCAGPLFFKTPGPGSCIQPGLAAREAGIPLPQVSRLPDCPSPPPHIPG